MYTKKRIKTISNSVKSRWTKLNNVNIMLPSDLYFQRSEFKIIQRPQNFYALRSMVKFYAAKCEGQYNRPISIKVQFAAHSEIVNCVVELRIFLKFL